MNDYMYPLKNCLERHWELYNKYPNSFFTGLTTSYPFLEIPKLSWINIYSPHPSFYLNVFEGEIEPTRTTIYPHYQKLPLKEIEHFVYTANIRELGELRLRGFWLGRNDSCSLEAALDLNGVNEAFSGAWGGADVDFHERLEIAYGQKYIIDRNVESLALELPNPWKGAKRSIIDVHKRDEMVYKTIRDPLTIAKREYRSLNNWDIRKEGGKSMPLEVSSRPLKLITLPFGELRFTSPGIVPSFLNTERTWEPFIVKDLLKTLQPGDTFLDIGANIGFYTILIGKYFKGKVKVIAFEPEPVNYSDLVFNIEHNKIKNVIAEEKAVLDRQGKAKLEIWEDPGWHRIVDNESPNRRFIEVDCIDIDSYLASSSFSVAKIDTEAKEKEIIFGMKKHLVKGVIIYIEKEARGHVFDNKFTQIAMSEIVKIIEPNVAKIKHLGDKNWRVEIE